MYTFSFPCAARVSRLDHAELAQYFTRPGKNLAVLFPWRQNPTAPASKAQRSVPHAGTEHQKGAG